MNWTEHPDLNYQVVEPQYGQVVIWSNPEKFREPRMELLIFMAIDSRNEAYGYAINFQYSTFGQSYYPILKNSIFLSLN